MSPSNPTATIFSKYFVCQTIYGLIFVFSFGNCCLFEISPDQLTRIEEGTIQPITINCSCCFSMELLMGSSKSSTSIPLQIDPHNPISKTMNSVLIQSVFILNVYSDNEQVVKPSSSGVSHADTHDVALDENELCKGDSTRCSAFYFVLPLKEELEKSFLFYVEAQRVGRTQISVSLMQYNTTNTHFTTLRRLKAASIALSVMKKKFLTISVVRKSRIFYTIFDFSSAFVASMTALSVGCCTNIKMWRWNLKQMPQLLMGLTSQHLLMPLIAFAVTWCLALPTDLAYGLMAISTVPGGGLAYLIVFLMEGDQQLSTVISFFNSITNFMMSWVWLYLMCYYWSLPLDLMMVFLWLSPVLFAHCLGIILQYYKSSVAEGILTWFTRPFLLFSGILLITLGVYINHYAFHFVNYTIVTAILSLICGGFCLGGGLGLVTKREKPVLKTLAAETSVFNCLIVIPALRYALPQPDADLAATVPLWGVFFTPTPVIIYFIVHKVKAGVVAFIEKRKEKQYKHYSIVNSLAKMTADMAALSAPIQIDANNIPSAMEENSSFGEKQERTTCV